MTDFLVVVTLLKRTFVELSRNWATALKSAWFLIVPLFLLVTWAVWAYRSGAMLAYLPTHVGGQAQFPVFAATLGFIALAGTLPAAVNWHRFGLVGEEPSALRPRFHFRLSLGYLGRMILLFIVGMVLGLVLVLVLSVVADRSNDEVILRLGQLPQPLTMKNILLGGLAAGLIYAVILPMSLILPAGTIGRKMGLKEARGLAKGKLGFFGFFLCGLFFHFAPILLDSILVELPLNDLGGLMLAPFVMLFWFMFGIAFLTVLYDHCVKPPQQE